MQLVRGMSLKDCREDDQGVTEIGNEGTSNDQTTDISNPENAGGTDIVRRSERRQKLTEKGLQYKQELLLERRSKLHEKLLRKSGMIEDMTYSWVNASAVREEMDQFNDIVKLFISAHEEYQSLLGDEDCQADSRWFDEFDERVFSFKHKMIKWLKEADLNNEEVKSRKSSKSGSSRKSSRSGSSRSSKESIQEKAIEEKLKVAELIAESKYAEQKMKMEYDQKKLEMEERVEKAKARAKVYSEIPLEDPSLHKVEKENHMEKRPGEQESKIDSRLSYDCKEFIPGKKYFSDNLLPSTSHVVNNIHQSDSEISKMLCQLIQQQGAPEVDIDTFSGDPLEYHYFMEVFKEVVERKIKDPRGRLTRLIKYTTGEAKDLIKHCIQQPLAEGYKNAMGLLESRYGDPLKILASYRREIRKWPMIKAGDATSFRLFHNFLLKCDSITSLQSWNALDSPETLSLMISKFPRHIRDRWNRKVLSIRRRHKREPTLSDLTYFIEEETALVNDPLFSNNAYDEYLEKPVRPARRSLKMNLTGTKEDDCEKKQCQMCQKFNHDLDACYKYKKLEVNERRKFLMKNKLCFGCYETISREHNGRNCPKRRTCSICKEQHPTGLHGLQPKKKSDEKEEDNKPMKTGDEVKKDASVKACASTVSHADVISMCVVPVKVKYKNSNSVYSTFAMLDNCSQGCFIKSSLVKNLKIQGNKTSVSVKTLTGEETHSSFAIDGLKVSRSSGLSAEWIDIPKAFTKDDLPVDSSEIATAEKIKKWKHLNEIADEINQSDDVNVELLIGANCTRALEPVQVIPSKDGGPYAMKTVLGWCIVGPIACVSSRGGSLVCNRIAVQEAGSSRIQGHYFAMEKKINPDEDIPAMLKKIYEGEFTEQPVKFNSIIGETLREVSYDDQQFLQLMDRETVRVNNHYVVPLPLKSNDVKFPNNRVSALKRLNCLQRKLSKDDNFYSMYKTFIDDLLAKGYAREAKCDEIEGKTWYIPHHGVIHPAKPGKVRVVFDCSAEFRGTDLTQEAVNVRS